MRAKRARRKARASTASRLLPALFVGIAGCADALPMQPDLAESRAGRSGGVHFTGSLDLTWPGGKGAGAPSGSARISQAEIAAFPGVPAGNPGQGQFTYRVVNEDGTVHREIGVKLTYVGLEDQSTNPGEVRFVGVVISDTKPCGGSQHGGGGCSHDDGGCSHDDGGGCSHDDGTTHDDGGCSHDDGTTHDDGGCSHDDGTTHDDGGCSHDDGTTHDDGGCSGGGGSGGHEPGGGGEPGGPGGRVTGADCRIGQVVIGWALDGATPAVAGDRISWKWMAPDAPKVLAIQSAIDAELEIPWPCKLCEKEILGGNLTLTMR